jgi:HEAT repeat protein
VLAALLGGCGPAKPTLSGGKPVSHWVEALGSPDAQLRKKAVAKLGNVGRSDPAAWPAVLGALKDPEAAVRREAVRAVLKFGPDAAGAVDVLGELQQRDADAGVRADAGRALEKLRRDGVTGR